MRKQKKPDAVDIQVLEIIEQEAGNATYMDVSRVIPGLYPAFHIPDRKIAKRVLYRLAARGYVKVDHMPHGCCSPHAWAITQAGKRILLERAG